MTLRMVAAVGLLVLLILAGVAIDAAISTKEAQRLKSWHSQVVHRPAAEQPVAQQTVMTSPTSTLTWTTTPMGRYLTFPCDIKEGATPHTTCTDVLASDRVVLHGSRDKWATYKVCLEDDEHCAPILNAFTPYTSTEPIPGVGTPTGK